MYPWLAKAIQHFQRARAGHAWLIYGDRGLGKADLANYLAQYKLCHHTNNQIPCGTCKSCLLYLHKNHPDLYQVSPEKTVLGVDDIRNLIEHLQLSAQQGTKKIALIHQAQRLNLSASNALLKILEEPPAQTLIFLITDKPWRLISTVRSRCQRLYIPTPPRCKVNDWLQSQGLDSQQTTVSILNMRATPLRRQYQLQHPEQDDLEIQLQRALCSQPQLPQGDTQTLLMFVDALQIILLEIFKYQMMKMRLSYSSTSVTLKPLITELEQQPSLYIEKFYRELSELKVLANETMLGNLNVHLSACLTKWCALFF